MTRNEKKVIFLTICIVVIFLAFITLVAPLFPTDPEASYGHFFYKNANYTLGTLLARWDSQVYISIADQGYLQNNYTLYSFFPLYPLIIHLVSFLTGNTFVAALITNIGAVLGGSWFMYKWIKEQYSENVALESVWFFLISPILIFLLAPYPESLFFFLCVAAFYFLEKNKFISASFFAALATLTRAQGMVLIIPLVISLLWKKKPKIHWKHLAIISIPLVLVILYYLGYKATGSRTFFTDASTFYGRGKPSLSGLVTVAKHLTQITKLPVHTYHDSQLDSLWIISQIAFMIYAFRWLPLRYSLFSLALLMQPLSSGTTISIIRLTAISPVNYLIIGQISHRHPLIGKMITFLSLTLCILFALLFTHWQWVG